MIRDEATAPTRSFSGAKAMGLYRSSIIIRGSSLADLRCDPFVINYPDVHNGKGLGRDSSLVRLALSGT